MDLPFSSFSGSANIFFLRIWIRGSVDLNYGFGSGRPLSYGSGRIFVNILVAFEKNMVAIANNLILYFGLSNKD
jgi:hypothetical protein